MALSRQRICRRVRTERATECLADAWCRCVRACGVAMILKKKARPPTPLMSPSAGRAHTCAGQTTLDAQDTGALLSLSSLSLSASYTDSVTRHKQMFSHCVPMFFSLLPSSSFSVHSRRLVSTHSSHLSTRHSMQTVAAGSSHVCASEPARRTHKHTHFARGLSASRAHCSLSHSNP